MGTNDILCSVNVAGPDATEVCQVQFCLDFVHCAEVNWIVDGEWINGQRTNDSATSQR
jgi:hypothetical protein